MPPVDEAESLSADDLRALLGEEEALAAAAVEKQRVLDAFGEALERDKDCAVMWRKPIEQRMIDDLRQKHGGIAHLPDAKGDNVRPVDGGNTTPDDFRRATDNITRPACIQIAARLGDMLFPTNEPNWSLEASPLPDLVNPDEVMTREDGTPYTQPGPDGQPMPMTAGDMAARVKELADRKCQRMTRQIEDALAECRYPSQGRAMIVDAVEVGTGVIKGPVVCRKRKTAYQSFKLPDGTQVPSLVVKADEKPALLHVDVWNFFPQPCRHIEEAEHAFELHLLTKKQIRELADQPGFDRDQLNRLLDSEPDMGSLGVNSVLVERDRVLAPHLDTMKGRYPMWEYHGPIPREALEAMGTTFEEGDNLTKVCGEVWFSQGIVVKVVLDPDEYSDRLNYYVFNYERDPTCVFGYSVPYVLRADQYAVTQTWQAVVLNAFMSAGAQVGVVKGQMEPLNGRIDLTCMKPKVWLMKGGEGAKIGDALSFWNMPNFTGPLLEVYEKARRNAADHTNLPSFVEGEPSKVAQTSSGLAMLMNAANVVQRDAAKSVDDNITVPGLSAMQRWFLLHGDDPEAKGDFDVIPKGESHLLIKDVQAQHVQVLTQIADLPRFAPYFDNYGLLTLNLKALNLDTTGVLRDKATVEAEQAQAAQNAPPDPATLKAEADLKAAEAAAKRIELDAQELALKQQQMALTFADKRDQRRADLVIEDAKLEIDGAKIALKEQEIAAGMDSRERIEAARLDLQGAAKGAELDLETARLAQQQQRDALEVAVEAPNPRLA